MTSKKPYYEIFDGRILLFPLVKSLLDFHYNIDGFFIARVVVKSVYVVFVRNLVMFETFREVSAVLFCGFKIVNGWFIFTVFVELKDIVEMRYAKVNGECVILDEESLLQLFKHI